MSDDVRLQYDRETETQKQVFCYKGGMLLSDQESRSGRKRKRGGKREGEKERVVTGKTTETGVLL